MQPLRRNGNDMSHPPEGCSYQVLYPNGSTTGTAGFPDEFALGRWFREQEQAGTFDRTSRGLSIYCVTTAGDAPIDVMHPRLVRGRIETPPPARSIRI